jgi:hypothetical protein
LTINKKNFRSTIVTVAFGALVSVLPASATSITLATSVSPTTIDVGGVAWALSGYATVDPTVQTDTSATFAALTPGLDSVINVNGTSVCSATNLACKDQTASQVIDVNVTPTIVGGGVAATAVQFQGQIIDNVVNGVNNYELYFGNQGTVTCLSSSASCATTANGSTITAAQTVVNTAAGEYTVISEGGVDYEIATATSLGASKPYNTVAGFVGIINAPEPATYATTGLGVALLGFFLRRKKQNS